MLKLKTKIESGHDSTHCNANVNLQIELDNLYGRLKGIRQLRGAMTSQSRRDFNRIVETLGGLGVLTRADVSSFHVNEFAGIEEALFSGIPERAAQLLAVLDHRKMILLRDVIEEKIESPPVKAQLRKQDAKAQAVLDDESRELILVGHAYSIVAEAGQIYRGYTNSEHGIDGEVEFKDDQGRASGKRLYVQLKSGDSYLKKRRRDGAEVFQIKNPRWSDYWQQQAYAVMLVIRASDGEIRWMDVSAYLKRESAGGKTVRQIIFAGERFDVMSVRRWRDKVLARMFHKGP